MKYTKEIARRTKDLKILIDILREGKNDWISCWAAENPNCPPEMLVEILKREKDDDVSQYAARNINCPSEILVEVLNKGKYDWISYIAVGNPNCPPEAKINWMYAIGKIGKEDPSKHIIEYENKKEDDFQDLKDLL